MVRNDNFDSSADLPAARGRPKTLSRQHVLDVATNALWANEAADVSLNAICQLAGVAKPSVYREFGSEDGLTTAVLEHYTQVALTPMDALFASPTSFAEKLEALIQFASVDPRRETGCLFVKMSAARSRFGEQTQTKLAEIEAHLLQTYIRFFNECAASGEWTRDITPELAAHYLHEQLALAVSQRAAGKSKESVRNLLVLALSALR